MKEITYADLMSRRITGRDCNWQFPIRKSRKVKMKFKDLPQESTGEFIRIQSGEAVIGVFRGEPHDYIKHWVNNRTEMCQGDGCENCAQGVKGTFRFRINFMVKEGNTYVAKIFEQGRRVYDQLKGLHADYDLEQTVVKITRQGSGAKDTTYTVLPVPKGTLSKEAQDALSKIKLHDLTNQIEEHAESNGDSDVPF